MESPAPISDVPAEKPIAPTLTPAQLRELIRVGFDTMEIAAIFHLTEAEIYNRMAGHEQHQHD